MDNVCHSLAGAAIAQAGFARKLPHATLLGVVAANIPDVDAFTYFFGDSATAVSFRRGWTHGIPALVVWAVVLAVVFARWNRRRPADYLALAAIAVLSHPCLDWLNTYGVRFLMPFSNEWFYGDTLFIVDPVLIALFAAGWYVSSRSLAAGSRSAELPARVALAAAILYVGAMKSMSAATLAAAREKLGLADVSARVAMVAPLPLSFTRREVLVRAGPAYDHYPATWTLRGPEIGSRESREASGDDAGVRATVLASTAGEKFLRWSRFPYFVPGAGPDAGTVFVGDVRYSAGTAESWAGIRIHH